MPWTSIKLKPGLNVELTDAANEAGYTSTQLGRFKSGLFQKVGGWNRYYINPIGDSPNRLHSWQDLSLNKRVATGNLTSLYEITSGVLNNISPQTLSTDTAVNFATTLGSSTVVIVDTNVNNITNYDSVYFNTPISVGGLVLSGVYQVLANVSPTSYSINAGQNATATVAAPGGVVPAFTTTASSSSVTVTFTAHGLSVGDDIVFPISTSIGGIAIVGRYFVQSVPNANQFIINSATAAASTAGPTSMNSNQASFIYSIAIGPQVAGVAYGSGAYGAGTYGFGTAIAGQTGTDVGSSSWSLDNWGELLIACRDGHGFLYWGPSSGMSNVMLVATAPYFNTGIFISIAQQIAIAYGSTQDAIVGVYHDPLLVRWCDVGDFFTWEATYANQAGSYRIPTGSRIVGGAATPHRNLIWTDVELWSMDYIGSAYVFGFNKIGSNCGLIAKNAFAQTGDTVFWMGATSFYELSGNGVQVLPCTIWDAVFQDLDLSNSSKCFSSSNMPNNEIWFFFPSISGGLGICDKYVKFNIVERTWDYGSLQRNAWIDSSIIEFPIAADDAGIIYQHEYGFDAESSPLTPSFTTGWFAIEEGRQMVFLDRIYPDFKWGLFNGSQNANINVTVYAVKYPGDTPVTYGPFSLSETSQFISQRLRARYIKLQVSSDDVGSFWRLGNIRVRWSPDGRR